MQKTQTPPHRRESEQPFGAGKHHTLPWEGTHGNLSQGFWELDVYFSIRLTFLH